MATFNLIRNSRVFFTTNVNASTGVVAASAFDNTNTFEIQVLDGFSFSQASNADTIQISEAGDTPVRGQRSFNTSLNNVEFSFSTYIRPKTATPVTAEESVLWNALLCDQAVGTAVTVTGATGATYVAATGILTIAGTGMAYVGAAVNDIVVVSGLTGSGASKANVPAKILTLSATEITLQLLSAPTGTLTLTIGTLKFNKCAWTENAAVATDSVYPAKSYAQATTALSNKNRLQKFGMIIKVDGITYVIDDCVMDQASIDFGLDGIAMVAWTGKGKFLSEKAVTWSNLDTTPTMAGDLVGTAKLKDTSASAQYITNKLSTVQLKAQIGGGGTEYTLALTGGNLTIANNVTYVTPANLGTVNIPIGYFTGTRAVSGNVTAYLRTGSTNTAGLLKDMLDSADTSAETKYQLKLDIGGASNNIRVELLVFGAALQIPAIDAQAVMSTTINFNAQGTDYVPGATAEYDLANTNDLQIRYFSS